MISLAFPKPDKLTYMKDIGINETLNGKTVSKLLLLGIQLRDHMFFQINFMSQRILISSEA